MRLLLIVWAWSMAQLPLQAQDFLTGKSPPVSLVPNGRVDTEPILPFLDSDRDGISNKYERANGLNPNDPSDALLDSDGEGLNNLLEFLNGTAANNPDSDGDGADDLSEILAGTDPLDPASGNAGVTLIGLELAPAQSVVTFNNILGGGNLQMRVQGLLSDGSTSDLRRAAAGTTYQSSNSGVLSVGPDGLISALGTGAASVTAANQAFSDSAEIEVRSFSPQGLGFVRIPGFAGDIALFGRFALVAAGATGLQVVDVSDPANPFIAARRDTSGNANSIFVSGNLAFIADGASGLQILDVSNPLNPLILGSAPTPGDALDVVVRGSRAYVALGNSGLQIVDVSDPSNPGLMGLANGAARAVDVSLNLGLAVVASQNRIAAVDVSDPESPAPLGTLLTETAGRAVAISASLAFVAGGLKGIQTVDLGDPSNLRILGSTDLRTNTTDLALAGNLVLAAENIFVNAVPIFGLIDPSAPSFLGSINFAQGPTSRDDNGTGIAVSRGLAYLTGAIGTGAQFDATGNTGLHIGRYLEFNDSGLSPPTVRVVNPGAVVEGTPLQVRVEASDDVFVNSVELIVDGALQPGPDREAPYQFQITVPLGQAEFRLSARAVDLAGNLGRAPEVLVPIVDDLPPMVAFVTPQPPAQAVVGTSLQVEVLATDDNSLSSVQFLVGGLPLATDFSAPFQTQLTLPSQSGPLVLEAVAVDNLGQSGSALQVIDVRPDQPPLVVLSSPQDGSEAVSGTSVQLSATASDDVAVASLQFFQVVDGTPLPVTDPIDQPPFEFEFELPQGSQGSDFTLFAQAIDSAGQVGQSDSATVRALASQPPSVEILSPQNGSTVLEGETIRLEFRADDDVFVTDGRALVNDELVLQLPGEALSAATDFVVPQGAEALFIEARATDGDGQTASVSIALIVEPDPLTTVIGRVLEPGGAPAGALVSVAGTQSGGETDSDGLFTLTGVPTVSEIVVEASGRSGTAFSAPFAPVAGGVTDAGDIQLPQLDGLLFVAGSSFDDLAGVFDSAMPPELPPDAFDPGPAARGEVPPQGGAVLSGDFLQIGVNAQGSLNFNQVGLRFDPSGSGNMFGQDVVAAGIRQDVYAVQFVTAGDILLEGFGGSFASPNDGDVTQISFDVFASPEIEAARSVTRVGPLQITTITSLGNGDRFATVQVELTNTDDTAPLEDLLFARSVDFDVTQQFQDAFDVLGSATGATVIAAADPSLSGPFFGLATASDFLLADGTTLINTDPNVFAGSDPDGAVGDASATFVFFISRLEPGESVNLTQGKLP